MEKHFCPHDGAVMQMGTRPLTLTYQGKSMTDPAVSGWHCPKCDEAFYDAKGSHQADRLFVKLKGAVFGFLPAPEIRRIRKKLGLSQKDAGLYIGGGIRAFQKYESCDVLPSQGIDSALRLLDHDPAQISLLKARVSDRVRKMYAHPTAHIAD